MNANEIADGLAQMHIEKDVNGLFNKRIQNMLRQQQAEIEKLRSWVEMLVEVPFFNEIDHYRGIPVAILRKAQKNG